MRKAQKALFLMVPAIALTISLLAVELPAFSIAPGEARDVLPRIEIRGVRTYQPRGRLLMTSIRLRRLTAFDAVPAWLDHQRQVVPERSVVARGETDREYRRQSTTQMDRSQIAAASLALSLTTRYPERHGEGVLVQDVVPGSPAEGLLFPGERITEIGGSEVEDLSMASTLLDRTGTRPFRAKVVSEDGSRLVTLHRVRVEGRARPLLGVSLVESFPFGVRIDNEDVGGPSGGLVFALAMVDLLTPGDLTVGRTVAGTGTVSLDGKVGGVGGVSFKVRGAEKAGAEIFLVPEENEAEARAAASRLRVVAVGSLEEALESLESGRP